MENVVWSDKTSVQLGVLRGFHSHCVRNRWNCCFDFMLWGCFNWFQKETFFIWKKETKKSRNEAEKVLKKWNEDHEMKHKKA